MNPKQIADKVVPPLQGCIVSTECSAEWSKRWQAAFDAATLATTKVYTPETLTGDVIKQWFTGNAPVPETPTPTVVVDFGPVTNFTWSEPPPGIGQMPLYAHPDTDELTKAAQQFLKYYDAPDDSLITALREALTAKPAKQYFIGPETMRMVFDPNSMTDMSDLQRVLDAVEVVLTQGNPNAAR